MVGVREVGSPEELVLAHERDHAREGALVRIAGDPALALEIDARLLREPGVAAERRDVDGVHPLEPVPDPARARLEHHDLQPRELLEHPELEHRREGVPHAVGRRHVDEERERGVRHAPEPPGCRPERLEAGMDGDRQPELLRQPEHAMVVRVPRRLPCHHERRDEDPLHAIMRGPRELALGLLGEPERKVRDRHESPPAPGAELDDPAVVGPRVRLRELQVLALRLPEDAERRVEDREVEVFPIESLEPLRRIPRPEPRIVEIPEPRPHPPRRRGDATHQVHRPEPLRQVPPHHLGGPPRDLEVLEPLCVPADAHRPIAEARLEMAVP